MYQLAAMASKGLGNESLTSKCGKSSETSAMDMDPGSMCGQSSGQEEQPCWAVLIAFVRTGVEYGVHGLCIVDNESHVCGTYRLARSFASRQQQGEHDYESITGPCNQTWPVSLI